MIHAVLEFLASFVASLFLTFVMLPVCLAVATPIVLLSAPFRPGRIRSDYQAVIRWWDKWMMILVS